MLEIEEKYHIFKVYDYKGGELRSIINLDYESFIGELAGLFEYIDLDELKSESEIFKCIKEIHDDKKEFYSLYAGGDGFCGNIYKTNKKGALK